jgi:hypothetical protein
MLKVMFLQFMCAICTYLRFVTYKWLFGQKASWFVHAVVSPIVTKVCAAVLFCLKTFCRLCCNFLEVDDLSMNCSFLSAHIIWILFSYVLEICIFPFHVLHSFNWGSCPAVVIVHAESAYIAIWLVINIVARLRIGNNGNKLHAW